MNTLSDIVAHVVGTENAIQMIHDGKVMLNGEVDLVDDLVFQYDVVVIADKKICYLGENYILQSDEPSAKLH